MQEKDQNEMLAVAQEAAMAAGKFLLQEGQAFRKINQEFSHDMKIEADTKSEEIILEILKNKSEQSILSEEKGLVGEPEQGLQWIVDPVDGSINYFQGIPMCCVSIGLWEKDQPLLGVVYDFQRDELFTGINGQTAYLNDTPIQVSQVPAIGKSVLCSGFPGDADLSTEGISVLIKQIQRYRKVRFLGSAALSLAYVACGRADAYYERDIMLWDIAGALPIILAAGGKYLMKQTQHPHSYHVFASNGLVQETL